ncbi:MAG: hypothetical protein RAK22_02730 [Nanoarchaeota archaeon]|nr:hypothetical protein [Nanoarchaeota archaeon]
MYGNSVGVSLSVMNAETGLTLGNVDTYILMNGSIITIQNPGTYGLSTSCSLPPSLSSKAAGMQVFCLSQPLSLNGMTISFPISLTSNEQSQLQSSSSRYFETQFKVITTYKYEQNGFFPISLQAEGYS